MDNGMGRTYQLYAMYQERSGKLQEAAENYSIAAGYFDKSAEQFEEESKSSKASSTKMSAINVYQVGTFMLTRGMTGGFTTSTETYDNLAKWYAELAGASRSFGEECRKAAGILSN
ncbi:MAG: hypothetical protein GY721_13800 [Deltaproteobacteria bacterium]|nr:hypothetical protein [Deltaproteobacteria bacterium]